jgi:hypothetical protein
LSIPQYSGDNQVKDSIECFLDKVDSTALLNHWDDWDTAEHVKVVLTGSAATTVLTADRADVDTWPNLRTVLYRRFVPVGQTDRYEADFRGRNIKPGESFEGFAGELKMLLLRWQPHAYGATKDATLLSQFCLGMNDRETGGRIKSTPGMTLDQAINVASSNKGFTQMMNARSMGKPAPSVSTAGVNYPCYECGRVYNNPPAQRGPQGNKYAEHICNNCAGKGHWGRDCATHANYVPSPWQSRTNSPGRSSYAGSSKSSGGGSYKG